MWGTNIFLRYSKQLGVTYFCFFTIIGQLCICNYLLFKTIGTSIYISHIVSLVLNMVSNMWAPNGLPPMLSKRRNCARLCGPRISKLVTCVSITHTLNGHLLPFLDTPQMENATKIMCQLTYISCDHDQIWKKGLQILNLLENFCILHSPTGIPGLPVESHYSHQSHLSPTSVHASPTSVPCQSHLSPTSVHTSPTSVPPQFFQSPTRLEGVHRESTGSPQRVHRESTRSPQGVQVLS